MQRYFLEIAYKGTAYKGFQKQPNAATIQSEVETALHTLFHQTIELTGSSRTDAGVHALQNFFHFDTDIALQSKQLYNLNAILPEDIVVKSLVPVDMQAHSRFSATSREYTYYIYRVKNPFLKDRAYFYPYQLDLRLLQQAAEVLFTYTDFTTFSKRNTQVKTFDCTIITARWSTTYDQIIFNVASNRFLRGMVRGLVGTMLRVGRGIVSIDEFKKIIESKDCSNADFSVPPQGLFLSAVNYPEVVWTGSNNC
ncbi:tRNA pseudouridine(38-40) synthase TruA [Ilyomonas limi]|uniref:tRNA pseudouridine synthase A n=1 Tax=Ilyomonas limi TaxID=2575867 RepID=A0A4U3L672_9BACT|nr:tRNA pseudouridine(38-40) synthase TruA [Ilyomonas limi]TKK69206.1 tRNA pseudouridine(38-40) synthase TruA [Ilyomonas limi]